MLKRCIRYYMKSDLNLTTFIKMYYRNIIVVVFKRLLNLKPFLLRQLEFSDAMFGEIKDVQSFFFTFVEIIFTKRLRKVIRNFIHIIQL